MEGGDFISEIKAKVLRIMFFIDEEVEEFTNWFVFSKSEGCFLLFL